MSAFADREFSGSRLVRMKHFASLYVAKVQKLSHKKALKAKKLLSSAKIPSISVNS